MRNKCIFNLAFRLAPRKIALPEHCRSLVFEQEVEKRLLPEDLYEHIVGAIDPVVSGVQGGYGITERQ